MIVCLVRSDTAPLGSQYISFLDEERLVNLFDSTRILSYSCRYGIYSDRTTLELGDDGMENLVVYLVESPLVYVQGIQGILGNLNVYMSVTLYLREIPYPLEQGVCDTGLRKADNVSPAHLYQLEYPHQQS